MTLKPTVRSKWTTTYLTSRYITAYTLLAQSVEGAVYNPSVNKTITRTSEFKTPAVTPKANGRYFFLSTKSATVIYVIMLKLSTVLGTSECCMSADGLQMLW